MPNLTYERNLVHPAFVKLTVVRLENVAEHVASFRRTFLEVAMFDDHGIPMGKLMGPMVLCDTFIRAGTAPAITIQGKTIRAQINGTWEVGSLWFETSDRNPKMAGIVHGIITPFRRHDDLTDVQPTKAGLAILNDGVLQYE